MYGWLAWEPGRGRGGVGYYKVEGPVGELMAEGAIKEWVGLEGAPVWQAQGSS